jgi:hypothetical protein
MGKGPRWILNGLGVTFFCLSLLAMVFIRLVFNYDEDTGPLFTKLVLLTGRFFWLPAVVGFVLIQLGQRGVPPICAAPKPRCLACGYDLTANVSGVGPECGTQIVKAS